MTDKVALITGASRGIGRGAAIALSKEGWDLAITFRSNFNAAKAAASEIKSHGGRAHLIQADLANQSDITELVEKTLDKFKTINLLVNNAGVAPRERVDILQLSELSLDEVMNVNLKGPFFLTQKIANVMIQHINDGSLQNPKIINISSISSYTSSPNRAEYCMSKAALSMTTKLWADRLAEYGINVYEIRPGIIKTDMTSSVQDRYDRLILEAGITPIRRWGTPEDVGKAVAAIAEDYIPFTTGEVLNVDGGFHISRL